MMQKTVALSLVMQDSIWYSCSCRRMCCFRHTIFMTTTVFASLTLFSMTGLQLIGLIINSAYNFVMADDTLPSGKIPIRSSDKTDYHE